jgi:hypothetical protein
VEASAAPLQLGSLPNPRTRLIGRETERATAQVVLREQTTPLLTLTGPGGVGKTRLALAIAEDVASAFTDGVIWVELAPLTVPAHVPTAVAAALGVDFAPQASLVDALARVLFPQSAALPPIARFSTGRGVIGTRRSARQNGSGGR